MAVAESVNLARYCHEVARKARAASAELALAGGEQRRQAILLGATAIDAGVSAILQANQLDLASADAGALTPAARERLLLTPERIAGMTQALREIAGQPDPIGETIEATIRPNGLEIRKVRVPLGVVFFIYESRPNVTTDAAALCLKSGNAVILRGGSEAFHSSRLLASMMAEGALAAGLPRDAVQYVEVTDRGAVGEFLALNQFIDLAIPRGGAGLIRRVCDEATMPVLKHDAGNCHVYVDRAADLDMAARILVNSKCQRYGVCNAAESLLVHHDIAEVFLPRAGRELTQRGVEIRGDETTCRLIPGSVRATPEDDSAEYLAPILSVRVVPTLDEAIAHINRHGSHHTDAIVTNDLAAARRFAREVDSAAVMINASTRFNDGGEFGLGGEIGISTDKFHARGPCGVNELTSYKYIVEGNGQVR